MDLERPLESAILKSLVEKISSQEILDSFRKRGFKEAGLKARLQSLKGKLLPIDAVLGDAQEKQFLDLEVKGWLNQITNVMYDLEDLLGEISTESSMDELGSEPLISRKEVDYFLLFLESMAEQMENLAENVRHKLRFREVSRPICEPFQPATTNSEDEFVLFGRDEDIKSIIKGLLSDNATADRKDVIVIVGKSGVGKTTVAQHVSNDVKVKEHFDSNAWVYVSETLDLNSVLDSLKSYLETRKFLLVLDNVGWLGKSLRKTLKLFLTDAADGSKFIVTTQMSYVAPAENLLVYVLKPLSADDSWKLFSKYAFPDKDSSRCADLEATGKEIVKRCYGLPLAAKMLGSVLRFKPQVEQWKAVLNRYVLKLKERDDITSALNLSYIYLPAQLKRCFAYCSIFPENHVYEKKKLVRLWMAEGFLPQQPKNGTTEEFGQKCFLGLTSRSYFDRSRDNKSGFVMHEQINRLARFICGEYCSGFENYKKPRMEMSARHLSISEGKFDILKTYIGGGWFSRLRTLIIYNLPQEKVSCHLSRERLDILPYVLPRLRVFSVAHCHITDLPKSIGRLKRLRYLDLSHTAIRRLPFEVCYLYNLQTLMLSNCHSLTELPAEMGKSLTKLSLLDIDGTNLNKIPAELEKLPKQHEYPLNQDSGKIDPHHKSNSEDVQLLQPPESLKRPSRENDRDPSLRASLRNLFPFSYLVVLRLGNHNCSCLPPLGRLKFLKSLHIEEMNQVQRVDSEFYGTNSYPSDEPFRCLGTLVLEGMLEWQEWVSPEVESVVFPSLQELCIRRCPKLKGSLPRCLPPSTKIEISECPELLETPETLPVKDDLKLDSSKMVPLGSDHNQGTSNAPKTDLSFSSHLESSKLTEDSTDTDNSEDSLEDTSSYESIKVSERWQMMTLPPQLHSLKIEGYDARNLPDELVHSNSHFRHLYIIDCCSLKSFQGGHLPNDLKTLYIRNCKDLEILPPAKTTGHYPNLERLCIGNSCDSIRYFPLACFPKLRSLVLRDCANLDSISMTEAHTSLNTLEIRGCHGLVSFPKGGLLMRNLKSILISNCKNLKELPDQLQKLTSLQLLFIKECPELVSIPEGGFPTKIILLCITSCHKLTPSTEWKLKSLDKLNHFEIDGGCIELKSFPVKNLLPPNLNSLRISRLPNLELLNYEGLQHLTSLATLEINCCDKLQSLPEEGLPSSLTSLYINECGLLKSKLEKKRRKDWHKITHIRRIQIDGKVIS